MRLFVWVSVAVIGIWLLGLTLWTGELRKETHSLASSASNFSAAVNQLKNSARLGAATGTLVFVGDIMLAREVGKEMAIRENWEWPFEKIKNYLAGADLAFGNLEGPISDQGKNQGSIYSFRADSRAVAGLRLAGIDMVSLANNHIWDWGRLALTDTLNRLRAADILPLGAGFTREEANRGEILDIKGTKVGFLAYTDLYPESLAAAEDGPGISFWGWDQVVADIKRLREQADVLVVSWHAGTEYEKQPNSEQRDKYRRLISSGADLVVGHHPHVVQPLEEYGGGWIAYSLGNFIFDQNFSEATMAGAALEVTVRSGKITGVKTVPIRISEDFQPSLESL